MTPEARHSGGGGGGDGGDGEARGAAGGAAPPLPARGPGSALLLSMDDFTSFKAIGKGKDSVVYSAACPKLGGATVALKVYDKARISANKSRSVRREARIMRFLTDARCGARRARGASGWPQRGRPQGRRPTQQPAGGWIHCRRACSPGAAHPS